MAVEHDCNILHSLKHQRKVAKYDRGVQYGITSGFELRSDRTDASVLPLSHHDTREFLMVAVFRLLIMQSTSCQAAILACNAVASSCKFLFRTLSKSNVKKQRCTYNSQVRFFFLQIVLLLLICDTSLHIHIYHKYWKDVCDCITNEKYRN